MIDQIQKTQQELRSALSVALSDLGQKLDPWPRAEIVGELIEFYSAQWGHLNALHDENRWLRSLPVMPYPERVAELRHLLEELLETAPPDDLAARALCGALGETLVLADAFLKSGIGSRLNTKLLTQIREHQNFLAETKDKLIEAESQMVGEVAPMQVGASRAKVERARR